MSGVKEKLLSGLALSEAGYLPTSALAFGAGVETKRALQVLKELERSGRVESGGSPGRPGYVWRLIERRGISCTVGEAAAFSDRYAMLDLMKQRESAAIAKALGEMA